MKFGDVKIGQRFKYYKRECIKTPDFETEYGELNYISDDIGYSSYIGDDEEVELISNCVNCQHSICNSLYKDNGYFKCEGVMMEADDHCCDIKVLENQDTFSCSRWENRK